MAVVSDAPAVRPLLQVLDAPRPAKTVRKRTRTCARAAPIALRVKVSQYVREQACGVARIVQVPRPELVLQDPRVFQQIVALLTTFHDFDRFYTSGKALPAIGLIAEPLERRAAPLILVGLDDTEGLVDEAVVPRAAPG